ncbi:MAG: hypothetical protein MJZ01_08830 [Bacteroidales bacterium]|nr:hypothetical protein [Bacteroidales bacterium]
MENRNIQKKERREWTVMNLFAESYAQFPIGEIEKSEMPDFIVKTIKGQRIGIELTELKYERKEKEFNMRAHEDFLSTIMIDAENIFASLSDQKLVVDVHFSDSIAPEIVQQPSGEQAQLISRGLSETIARIVNENMPESTGKHYIVDRTSKYGDMNLPHMIETMHITNVTGRMEEPLWYASISTRVKPLSVESIVQRIDDKDHKLANYDKTCDKQWLIIIQNSFLMSSKYDPVVVQRALRHRYSTIFDKVFVFERSEAKVSELNLIRRINTSR